MTDLSKMNAHERLCLVISILQVHIMAADSNSKPEKMFESNYMPTASLEACERMLVGLLEDFEVLEHRQQQQ